MKPLHLFASLLLFATLSASAQVESTTGTEQAPVETSATMKATVAENTDQTTVSNTTSSDTLATAAGTSGTSTQTEAATPPKAAADNPTSISLANGIYYQVLKEGSGPEAGTTQTQVLHYTLYLTNGTKIESSRDADLPVPLRLKAGQGDFIPGFEAGVKGMKVGEVRRIFVPSSQGYGGEAKGAIAANTDLLFETELVDVR